MFSMEPKIVNFTSYVLPAICRRAALVALIGLQILAALSASAVSFLSPGDIAIVGYEGKNPGSFSFVPLVPLDGNLDIRFSVSNNTFVVWRSPQAGVPAGTVVGVLSNAVAGTGTTLGSIATNGVMDFESGNDQLLVAYNGDYIYVAENSPDGTYTPPPPLTYALNTAVSHLNGASGGNNGRYKGTALRIGTRQELLSAIAKQTNWEYSAASWGNSFFVAPYNAPFTIVSTGPRWTGTVVDGYRRRTGYGSISDTLSSLGVLSGIQTDDNDALSNGCSAPRATSTQFGSQPWLSVYFSNNYPSDLEVLSAKIYIQHQATNGTGSGTFIPYVSNNRTVTGWYTGGVGVATITNASVAFAGAELETIIDVTPAVNTPGKVNNCELLLLNNSPAANNYPVGFDFIKLEVEYSLAGPPSVDNGAGASNLLPGSARLNGRVLAGVPDPHVWIYWGDSNGGTNAGSWSNVVDMGIVPIGNFFTTVTNLLGSQTYFYRCYATNTLGKAWASSTASFVAEMPTLQFATASSSNDESVASVTVNVVLSNPSAAGSDVRFHYDVSGGTAANGTDFSLTPGNLTIPAGSLSTSFTFTVSNDLIDEYDETVVLSLSALQNAAPGVPATHTYTIIDNDGPPSVSLSSSTFLAREDGVTAVVAVVLSPLSGKPVQVNYATQSGTAIDGQDFTGVAGTLTWQPGQGPTNAFTIPMLNDSTPEGIETFGVSISSPSNALIGGIATAEVSIVDDDLGPPQISNGSGATGVTSNSAALNGSLLSNGGADTTVIVCWGLTDGLTNVAAWANVVTVGVFSVNGPFSLPVGGLARNTGYYYRCLASNTYGAAWAASTASFLTGPPTVQFAAAASSNSEAVTSAALEVRLTSPSVYGLSVTAACSVVGGAATSGQDFTPPLPTVVIPAGASNAFIFLTVADDSTFEFNETIDVAISNAVNATLGSNRLHTYTILDNDPTPTVSLVGGPYFVDEAAGWLNVTATLAAAAEREVTVSCRLAGGTAVPGTDYRAANGIIQWAANQSGARTLSVEILNNSAATGNRTLYATLNNPTGCTISGNPAALITIVEDDAPAVSVLNRGASGVRSTRATLSGEVIGAYSDLPVSVYWNTTDKGTNVAAWTTGTSAGSASAGKVSGLFSVAASGLTKALTYYYRCCASNGSAQVWSASAATFTTLNGIDYFVNDGRTNGDMYCSATGRVGNTGLTAASPAASLDWILANKDLNPNDTVYIDTGNYTLDTSIVIPAEDTGSAGHTVAFIGSTNSAGTWLRCTDPVVDVIYMENPAGHVRFERLRLTGGWNGLQVYGGYNDPCPDIQVVDCEAATNDTTGSGLNLRYCTNVQLTGNRISDDGFGINLWACNGVVVTSNRCEDVFSDGILAAQVTSAVIASNLCQNNGYNGIYVEGPSSRVEGNTCLNNQGSGIYVGDQAAQVVDNVVGDSGGYGIETLGLGDTIRNNLLYRNDLGGIRMSDLANTAVIERNTVYGGDGLCVRDPAGVTNRNNVIWATGSGNAAISLETVPSNPKSFVSDFNNLYATTSAGIGMRGGSSFATLAAWRTASTQDLHSISADPLFVTNNDFHLQSQGGSWHGGQWLPDSATSPSIDAGDPAADYSLEPSFSGLCLNQGADGNTPEASRTFYDGPICTLTVATNPPGAGRVTWSPQLSQYLTNRVITIQALATNSSFVWDRWTGGLSSTNAQVSFTLASNTVLVAQFVPKGWVITATTTAGGVIQPSGTVVVVEGSNQAFTISATLPRYIDNVLVDGISKGPTNAWLFVNVRTNHTIHAIIAGQQISTAHGTPIAWLEMYGFTNNYEVADTNDADKDGAPTWQEYLAGTIPTNDLSVFRLIRSYVAQGSNTIEWYGTTNSGVFTPFLVQSSTNLTAPGWTTAATNLMRDPSGTNKWSMPVPAGQTPSFLRPGIPSGN